MKMRPKIPCSFYLYFALWTCTPCFSQKPQGIISGRVLCSDTGRPARFASVQVLGISGIYQTSGASQTDAEGLFTVVGLPPGDYIVSGDYPGYINRTKLHAPDELLGSEATKSGEVFARLNAIGNTSITVYLLKGSVLSGTVRYSDGSAAVGLEVDAAWAENGDGTSKLKTADTDDRGIYRLVGLRPGKYRVVTKDPIHHSSWFLGDTQDEGSARIVDVGEEEYDALDLNLP